MQGPRRVLVTALGAAASVAFAVTGGVAMTSPAQGATGAPPSTASSQIRVVAAEPGDLAAAADERVTALPTREQAASIVMGHVPGTDPTLLAEYMRTTGIGGFILMGANIPADEAALREITASLAVDASLPPLIGIDEEGGDVTRLPWDAFASARTLKDAAPDATVDAFAARAALLQRVGVSVNFGIVADVTEDRSSFIYRRALGTTPDAGAQRVAAAVTGEGAQVASTLKHFPGHGAAPGDSHRTIPATDLTLAQWTSAEALPFQAGIDAGAPLLMFGHLVYSSVDAAPASLSSEWHRIAHEELGFEGISITDDLGMLENSGLPEYQDPVANAVAAVAAGNDVVLSIMLSDAATAPRIVDGIVAAVDDGTLPAERLHEAANRVMELRLAQAAAGRGLVPCPDCAPAD